MVVQLSLQRIWQSLHLLHQPFGFFLQSAGLMLHGLLAVDHHLTQLAGLPLDAVKGRVQLRLALLQQASQGFFGATGSLGRLTENLGHGMGCWRLHQRGHSLMELVGQGLARRFALGHFRDQLVETAHDLVNPLGSRVLLN